MKKIECQCSHCQGACKHNPGWFKPGEAEKAAKLKGMNLPDFFKQYLGINWWEGDGVESDDDIFVLAPAIVDMTPGEEYPADPRGVCVFFIDGKCDIHDAKPYECRSYIHTETDADVHERHWAVAKVWQSKQSQITKLLGREPETAEFNGGGIFGMLGKMWG